ncbi:unnamed protein product, partial [Ectocarpus sp. 12 AP-2014]
MPSSSISACVYRSPANRMKTPAAATGGRSTERPPSDAARPSERDAPAATGHSRWLDAFTVVLSQNCSGGVGWLASASELRLISLQSSVECRSLSRVALRVSSDTPERLWVAGEATDNALPRDRRHETVSAAVNLPQFRVVKATWLLPTSALKHTGPAFAGLEE